MTAISLAAAVALLVSPRAARADGAFPDSLGIIAPADRPHDIVVPTTFGVVSSIDDGQTWTWSCEQDKNSFGAQYQMSAPPLDRLYTRSQGKLAFSDDRACGWNVNGGAVGTASITDAFPDPTNANRVLVIAMATDADGGLGYSVYESSDAGATFSTLRYTAASGDIITGVEIARADAGDDLPHAAQRLGRRSQARQVDRRRRHLAGARPDRGAGRRRAQLQPDRGRSGERRARLPARRRCGRRAAGDHRRRRRDRDGAAHARGRRDDGVRAHAFGRDAARRQGRARPGDVPLDRRRGDVSDAAGAADAAGHGRAREPDLRRVGHADRRPAARSCHPIKDRAGSRC